MMFMDGLTGKVIMGRIKSFIKLWKNRDWNIGFYDEGGTVVSLFF